MSNAEHYNDHATVKNGASDESAEPMHALLIEDEQDHCELIQECFERNASMPVHLVYVHTVHEACELLEDQKFDFVLLDHSLPDGTGSDVLERMSGSLMTTPVIGLSTSSDPDVALADFRGGAVGFLEKHTVFQGDALTRRVYEILADHKRRLVAHSLERVRKDGAYRTVDEHILAAGRIDSLTRLLNRGAFDEAHESLHEAASVKQHGYSICFVDVDMFKKYNDRYGHAAGDDALRRVSTALAAALRPKDVIGRYGGEEFVIMLGEGTESDLPAVLERLRRAVEQLCLVHADNIEHSQKLTISIGGAWCGHPDREQRSEVVKRADRALYKVKANGRNSFSIADDMTGENLRCA